ncbi:MAG TPA: hypothetical protein VH254_04865 [Candidatus Udaeobacter sp.]|jgi:hypothetical protein|nr:hypothetical protein [Candidatus Udaeobacter sp.]
MQRLVRHIKQELRTAKHCAVYNEELYRVWPQNGKQRETEIARFASDHGWRLRYYRDGFCAIFDKAAPSAQAGLMR